VSKGGYRRCIVSPRGRPPVYTSGHDAITLPRGTHYFICSKPGHCAAGMKLAVTASTDPSIRGQLLAVYSLSLSPWERRYPKIVGSMTMLAA
jgi:hypothetical protein